MNPEEGNGSEMGRPKGSKNAHARKDLGTIHRVKPVTFVEKNGCFICTSHRCSLQGYPVLRKYGNPGKLTTVARHIYEECFGEIPKGKVLRHTCDNKLCINPEHLIIGTYKDNTNDMVQRGRARHPKGSQCGKLTERVVQEIRDRKYSILESRRRYGVSGTTVVKIRDGRLHP